MSEQHTAPPSAPATGEAAERAAIVRWLRHEANIRAIRGPWGRLDADILDEVARSIERREHLR